MATKPLDALTDVLEPERPAARTDQDQARVEAEPSGERPCSSTSWRRSR